MMAAAAMLTPGAFHCTTQMQRATIRGMKSW